ncbi:MULTISPECIES: LGFP repeat-containing protein, partial [unclassified Blastococcus]
GRYNAFAGGYGGGSIHWSPSTGAHETYGEIRDRWEELGWEQGVLGYPITGELGTADGEGRYNHFAGGYGGGSIYWSPSTGAHEVYGEIRDRWERSGWEMGPLGYPVSGEYDVPGGRRSDFQNGYITWDRATNTTELVVTD